MKEICEEFAWFAYLLHFIVLNGYSFSISAHPAVFLSDDWMLNHRFLSFLPYDSTR